MCVHAGTVYEALGTVNSGFLIHFLGRYKDGTNSWIYPEGTVGRVPWYWGASAPGLRFSFPLSAHLAGEAQVRSYDIYQCGTLDRLDPRHGYETKGHGCALAKSVLF